MKARDISAYLATHAASTVWAFGVVREDESVLAFGTENQHGDKTRVGSVTYHGVEGDEHFLVLQYPNSENEFRAQSLSDLGWFLWKLAQTGGDWETASDWMRSHLTTGVL